MAKYERTFQGDFDDVLRFCNDTLNNGSLSITLEESADQELGDLRVAVRAYERYSYLGGNRVSLSLTLAAQGRNIFICVMTTGGSQAIFLKINHFGEDAFLNTLVGALEEYISTSS